MKYKTIEVIVTIKIVEWLSEQDRIFEIINSGSLAIAETADKNKWQKVETNQREEEAKVAYHFCTQI